MPKRNKQLNKQLRRQPKSEQPKSEQPKSEPAKPKHKIWKRIAVCDTYDDATVLKTKILCEAPNVADLEVKIKRFGDDGSQFQVKVWLAPLKKQKRGRGE